LKLCVQNFSNACCLVIL